jgi:hypothetical protein
MKMEKYTYDTENNEKLTEVTVQKVWLKEHLMLDDSKYQELFPDTWISGYDKSDVEYDGFFNGLRNLHQMITSSFELFILFITTESSSSSREDRMGQRAYLSNKDNFMDITWLIDHSSLSGCRFQNIHPPYEDFINEFIGEVYF